MQFLQHLSPAALTLVVEHTALNPNSFQNPRYFRSCVDCSNRVCGTSNRTQPEVPQQMKIHRHLPPTVFAPTENAGLKLPSTTVPHGFGVFEALGRSFQLSMQKLKATSTKARQEFNVIGTLCD
ncbi:uncharacterized protein PV07_10993 [Cladophialophora immunda]|uniref:Uncharacterized protein n=1 Tax=Cladophialophora immunda TaxID=569365 RepID=A0A0D2ACY8_9EURO|nr:uncharacterized protein PV07_10993 [Cladophialophora immunda]KIW22727.1 hypothetical protein PV07_10993 [Cladophialophora immunda]